MNVEVFPVVLAALVSARFVEPGAIRLRDKMWGSSDTAARDVSGAATGGSSIRSR